jgi:hypothetical protein
VRGVDEESEYGGVDESGYEEVYVAKSMAGID